MDLAANKQFVENLGRYTVLTTSIRTVSTWELFLKRLMDILGGIVGCILTGILFLILAPMIYHESPGPIFFGQTRIGKNGKKFTCYKFRSMYLDAEERKAALAAENRVSDGMMFKLDFDPRIIGSRRLPDGTIKKGLGNKIRVFFHNNALYKILPNNTSSPATHSNSAPTIYTLVFASYPTRYPV